MDQDKRLRAEAEERLAAKFGNNVDFQGISSASVSLQPAVATEEVAKEESASDSDSDSDSDLEAKKHKKDWKKEVKNNE